MDFKFKNILKDTVVLANNGFFYYEEGKDSDHKDNMENLITPFYNKNPFPNYEKGDDIATLIERHNNNDFSFSLINSINYKRNHNEKLKILEVGCGTGQLSNLIAKLSNTDYFGVDITPNSLKVASSFAKSNDIKNLNYILMDIFNPIFKEKSFDIIISNGVLHHTPKPYLAFQNCTKLLKDDGIICVGLYNKIGRFKNTLIKTLYKITRSKKIFNLDFIYRNIENQDKKEAWLMDQYFHPQEKRFSYNDLLSWYKSNKIKPMRFIPDMRDKSIKFQNIFSKTQNPTTTSNLLNEINMFFFNKEGGLYILIGKK